MKNLILALATGYILFVFSERVFWAVWRPEDSIMDLAITWLVYSAIAYLFLMAIRWGGVDGFWPVFLAGSIYGWLVEGALADTLYGTQPSAPFPVSISITGLSWHALISVMLGWWTTGRAIAAASAWRLVWVSLAVGVFWGLWAMFPLRETPPIVASIDGFLVNALWLTLGLIAAWWINIRVRLRAFQPGWLGILVCSAIVAVFYVQHAMRLGAVPLLLLPALLGVAAAPLLVHRRRCGAAAWNGWPETCFPSRLAVLFLTPITATLVYALAAAMELDRFPIPFIVYAATGLAGFVLLPVAVGMTLRKSRGAASQSCCSAVADGGAHVG